MAWALKLDGVNDYMSLASEVSKSSSDEYTIVIKFKVDTSPAGDVLPFLYKDAANYFYYRVSNERFVWAFSGSIAQLTGVALSDVNADFVEVELSKEVGGNQTITFNGSTTSFGGARAFSFDKFFNAFDYYEGQVEFIELYSDVTKTNLVNKWSATASSHAAGTPVLVDTVGSNNATGVNMPTDGSAWVDLGGGGISVTESLVNSNYVSLDSVITLTGTLSITESLVNTNYTALNPSISFAGIISISEQLKNTNYTSLDPIIDLTGLVDITENLVNTNYNAFNPVITLTSGVVAITESLVNTQYNVFNPGVLLTPEPLGIVSTVCFSGVIEDLIFNGLSNSVVFNGNIEDIAFIGNMKEVEFNGTIQTTCNTGSIKTNC